MNDPARRFFLGFFAIMLVLAPALQSGLARAELHFSVFGLMEVSQSSTTSSGATVTSDGTLGYGGGASIEPRFTVSRTLGTELGLAYLKRMNGFSDGSSVTSQWIEVPLILRVHMGPMSIGAGGYAALGVGSVSSTIASDSSLKKLDYGALASLQISISRLFIDGRYTLGLVNVSDVAGTTTQFSDIQLLLGVHF